MRAGRVHAEGDLDVRGRLGDREAQVGFFAVRLSFELDGRRREELAKLPELTERYQTLAGAPALSTALSIE